MKFSLTLTLDDQCLMTCTLYFRVYTAESHDFTSQRNCEKISPEVDFTAQDESKNYNSLIQHPYLTLK